MLCSKVVFPSKKIFVKEIIPTIVEMPLVTYVKPTFSTCLLATCTFDILWVSIGVHNMFAHVVVDFLSNKEPQHVILGLFEPIKTCEIVMAPKPCSSSMTEKTIVYVKDKEFNLQSCIFFNFMVSCKSLEMPYSRSPICLFQKQVFWGLTYAFVKGVQMDIQTCITWLKNSNKWKQAWK